MLSSTDRYPGYRFRKDAVAYAVWLYHRFTSSLRDVQGILFERGVVVSQETLRQWGEKFGPEYVEKLRRREPMRGGTWHLDETAVKLGREQHWLIVAPLGAGLVIPILWRAVDRYGYVPDILLQEHHDKEAAERFFERLLDCLKYVPKRVMTDKLRSYAAALRELPLTGGEHEEVREAARQDNLNQAVTSADPRAGEAAAPFPLAAWYATLLNRSCPCLQPTRLPRPAYPPTNTVTNRMTPFGLEPTS